MDAHEGWAGGCRQERRPFGHTTKNKEVDVYTIKTTRKHYNTILTDYFGTFANVDAAVDAAVKVEKDPLCDPSVVLDVVPIPDGVTPKALATDYC